MTSILEEICQLFCCPPRPSHIVAKLAFVPPPPTYAIIGSPDDHECLIEFKPEAGWLDDDTSKLTVFYTTTKRQSKIACMYIPATPTAPNPLVTGAAARNLTFTPTIQNGRSSQPMSASCPTLLDDLVREKADHPDLGGHCHAEIRTSRYTVLFSHGNAVDIGQMARFLHSLAYRFNVNVLCYDYSGYGVSTGQRLEDNLYADIEAVLNELRQRYNVALDQIVLYGQSIGTAPTVDLATKYKVAGVILHSPFISGLRVVCPSSTRRFCFDPLSNVEKIERIQSPTLIIHGTEDELIGIHHGRELFHRLPHPLEPAWVDGAGHNDIEMFSEYVTRLDRFFMEDLPNSMLPDGDHERLTPIPSPISGSIRPSPRQTVGSSIFERAKVYARHGKSAQDESRVSNGRNASTTTTVDSTDPSRSDTCSESVASVQSVDGTVVSSQPCPPTNSVSGDQDSVTDSVTCKPRVWSLRRKDLFARSKTMYASVHSETTIPGGSNSQLSPEAVPRSTLAESLQRRWSSGNAKCANSTDPNN